MEAIKNLVNNWNLKTNEREKLQHVYLIVAVLVVFSAGLITLFNPNLGRNVVLVAFFSILAFLANAVIWNLLNSGLLAKLPSRSRRK